MEKPSPRCYSPQVPREKCGIVAIYSKKEEYDVVPLAITALRGVQNRGQEGWGIATNKMATPFKATGLVPEYRHLAAELGEDMEKYLPKSNMAIAHTMYTTSSTSSIENFQPLKIEYSGNSFFIAHNGNVEVDMLSGMVGGSGNGACPKDTNLMGALLGRLYSENNDWLKAFESANLHLKGSYSVVILDRDRIIAARGGGVNRPLCRGYHFGSESNVIASESTALDYIGAKLERDIRPGEVVRIDGEVKSSHFSYDPHFYCPFEFTYFSKASSREDGWTIQLFRKELGKQLATLYEQDIAAIKGKIKREFGEGWKERILVAYVPDSARPIAAGFSQQSDIPLDEVMVKDRYRYLRSFIDPHQSQRERIVRQIEPIYEVIDGKYLVIIDDSNVRATSSQIIVKKMEDAGALAQAWFFAFPPIVSPCFAGIDFANPNELMAYNICKKYGIDYGDVRQINKKLSDHLGVDFVGYMTFDSLSNLLGLPCCHSCTSGEYMSVLGYEPRQRTKEELTRGDEKPVVPPEAI
jgi:amidophosphoribosyltransferase